MFDATQRASGACVCVCALSGNSGIVIGWSPSHFEIDPFDRYVQFCGSFRNSVWPNPLRLALLGILLKRSNGSKLGTDSDGFHYPKRYSQGKAGFMTFTDRFSVVVYHISLRGIVKHSCSNADTKHSVWGCAFAGLQFACDSGFSR